MKFKDMPYERVDLDALGKEFDSLTKKSNPPLTARH